MSEMRIQVGQTVDLNVALGAAAADAGITYQIKQADTNVASVDASGVVTPASAGQVVVEALAADGAVIKQFTVHVVSAAEASVAEANNISVEMSGSDGSLPVVGLDLDVQ